MEKEKTIIREFFIEEDGKNKLVIKQNQKTIAVFLQLQAEKNRKRRIGVVTKSTKTFFVKRERDKHLFIKGNAYGFNDYVLKNQTSFDKVALFDGIEHWKIPVQFIIENGKYLMFKQQGFERQLFVSLEQIEKFKISEKENRRI